MATLSRQTTPGTVHRRASALAIEVLRPVFWLGRLLLLFVYKVFFSWWMNPLFNRWVRKNLAEDIRLAMPFLFDLYGARVVADPKPAGNAHAMSHVSIAAGGLILKFGSWRDESYGVEISPAFAPSDFCELLDALKAIDPTVDTEVPALEFSWRAWGKLLEPRFQVLERAFNEQHFAETKARIAELSTTTK